jgi:hypothetical protein
MIIHLSNIMDKKKKDGIDTQEERKKGKAADPEPEFL